MLRVFFAAFLVLLLQSQVQCQGPPKVAGSYKAYGEMVETLEDTSNLVTQIAFEESYDAETQNAAFVTWVMGKNVTFIENFKTNQTFRYLDGKVCDLLTVEEWIKTKSPPSLLGYEDTNGTVRFSLKQLFALDNKYLKERNLSATYRGIPARKWMYELIGFDSEDRSSHISVYSYWSDAAFNTTSSNKIAPLGFVISKMSYVRKKGVMKVHEQFINVYGFVPDTFERKLFEPVQGVVCPGRVQTLKFPDVRNWQAVAIHSEMLLPDYQEIKYVDTYYNSRKNLVRVDYERIKDQDPIAGRKQRRYQSETAIGDMGVVFRLTYDKGQTKCNVLPFSTYEFDVQNLFNFKLPLKEWKMGKLFGLNSTTYVYTGKTTKRDIPCHVFQGIRKDWPEPSAGVSSLWEWCFNINMTKKGDRVLFRNDEVGLINAQVKILESDKKSDYPPDFKMIHHFYDIEVKDPNIIDSTNFDISRCFDGTQKRSLQFAVDWKITDDNYLLVENATSDATFLRLWKEAIYQQTGLQPYSLRIANVRSTVIKRTMLIKFTILSPHKDLPQDIKKSQKSAFDAENSLRDNINAGKVSIMYKPNSDSKFIPLFTVKHSLQFQLNRTFIPHTLPPTESPPTGSTKIIFTLRTEPPKKGSKSTPDVSGSVSDGGSTSPVTSVTGETGEPNVSTTPNTIKEKEKKSLHQAGTVAGVSIAVLLVGVSIGCAGTFYKYNGLPSWLRGNHV